MDDMFYTYWTTNPSFIREQMMLVKTWTDGGNLTFLAGSVTLFAALLSLFAGGLKGGNHNLLGVFFAVMGVTTIWPLAVVNKIEIEIIDQNTEESYGTVQDVPAFFSLVAAVNNIFHAASEAAKLNSPPEFYPQSNLGILPVAGLWAQLVTADLSAPAFQIANNAGIAGSDLSKTMKNYVKECAARERDDGSDPVKKLYSSDTWEDALTIGSGSGDLYSRVEVSLYDPDSNEIYVNTVRCTEAANRIIKFIKSPVFSDALESGVAQSVRAHMSSFGWTLEAIQQLDDQDLTDLLDDTANEITGGIATPAIVAGFSIYKRELGLEKSYGTAPSIGGTADTELLNFAQDARLLWSNLHTASFMGGQVQRNHANALAYAWMMWPIFLCFMVAQKTASKAAGVLFVTMVYPSVIDYARVMIESSAWSGIAHIYPRLSSISSSSESLILNESIQAATLNFATNLASLDQWTMTVAGILLLLLGFGGMTAITSPLVGSLKSVPTHSQQGELDKILGAQHGTAQTVSQASGISVTPIQEVGLGGGHDVAAQMQTGSWRAANSTELQNEISHANSSAVESGTNTLSGIGKDIGYDKLKEATNNSHFGTTDELQRTQSSMKEMSKLFAENGMSSFSKVFDQISTGQGNLNLGQAAGAALRMMPGGKGLAEALAPLARAAGINISQEELQKDGVAYDKQMSENKNFQTATTNTVGRIQGSNWGETVEAISQSSERLGLSRDQKVENEKSIKQTKDAQESARWMQSSNVGFERSSSFDPAKLKHSLAQSGVNKITESEFDATMKDMGSSGKERESAVETHARGFSDRNAGRTAGRAFEMLSQFNKLPLGERYEVAKNNPIINKLLGSAGIDKVAGADVESGRKEIEQKNAPVTKEANAAASKAKEELKPIEWSSMNSQFNGGASAATSTIAAAEGKIENGKSSLDSKEEKLRADQGELTAEERQLKETVEGSGRAAQTITGADKGPSTPADTGKYDGKIPSAVQSGGIISPWDEKTAQAQTSKIVSGMADNQREAFAKEVSGNAKALGGPTNLTEEQQKNPITAMQALRRATNGEAPELMTGIVERAQASARALAPEGRYSKGQSQNHADELANIYNGNRELGVKALKQLGMEQPPLDQNGNLDRSAVANGIYRTAQTNGAEAVNKTMNAVKGFSDEHGGRDLPAYTSKQATQDAWKLKELAEQNPQEYRRAVQKLGYNEDTPITDRVTNAGTKLATGAAQSSIASTSADADVNRLSKHLLSTAGENGGSAKIAEVMKDVREGNFDQPSVTQQDNTLTPKAASAVIGANEQGMTPAQGSEYRQTLAQNLTDRGVEVDQRGGNEKLAELYSQNGNMPDLLNVVQAARADAMDNVAADGQRQEQVAEAPPGERSLPSEKPTPVVASKTVDPLQGINQAQRAATDQSPVDSLVPAPVASGDNRAEVAGSAPADKKLTPGIANSIMNAHEQNMNASQQEAFTARVIDQLEAKGVDTSGAKDDGQKLGALVAESMGATEFATNVERARKDAMEHSLVDTQVTAPPVDNGKQNSEATASVQPRSQAQSSDQASAEHTQKTVPPSTMSAELDAAFGAAGLSPKVAETVISSNEQGMNPAQKEDYREALAQELTDRGVDASQAQTPEQLAELYSQSGNAADLAQAVVEAKQDAMEPAVSGTQTADGQPAQPDPLRMQDVVTDTVAYLSRSAPQADATRQQATSVASKSAQAGEYFPTDGGGGNRPPAPIPALGNAVAAIPSGEAASPDTPSGQQASPETPVSERRVFHIPTKGVA